jgi:Cu2+-exporting ATPase
MEHQHQPSSEEAPGHLHDAHGSMAHGGHNHHAMMIADFKKRFYIVLILTLPILLLSTTIQHWLNIHIHFPGSPFVLLALAPVVYFYGGWPWHDDLDRICYHSGLCV